MLIIILTFSYDFGLCTTPFPLTSTELRRNTNRRLIVIISLTIIIVITPFFLSLIPFLIFHVLHLFLLSSSSHSFSFCPCSVSLVVVPVFSPPLCPFF